MDLKGGGIHMYLRALSFFPLSFIAVVSSELLPTETCCAPDAPEIACCHHYKSHSALQHTHMHTHISMDPERKEYSFKIARKVLMHSQMHIHATFIWGAQSPRSHAFTPSWRKSLLQIKAAGEPHTRKALNRTGYKGVGLKIRGNSVAMTEAGTITGSLRCLMPNGPLRTKLTGQLP